MSKEDNDREPLTDEEINNLVWSREADYIHLDIKRMTAERMTGWLREFADYCDEDGYSTTADHARAMSEVLRRELNK